MKRACEHPVNGQPCAAGATFNVTRGRKHDAEDSCRRHLAAVVEALMQADRIPVTVTKIRDGAA